MCHRYTTFKEGDDHFSTSPRDGSRCDMFFGDGSKRLIDYLHDIVEGKYNKIEEDGNTNPD